MDRGLGDVVGVWRLPKDFDTVMGRIRDWSLVILGGACMAIMLVVLVIVLLNPSLAILEEEALTGVTQHTVTVDSEFVVLDFGKDVGSNLTRINYTMSQVGTDRTVVRGWVRVDEGVAEVRSSTDLRHRIEERGDYRLRLEPTPVHHGGTYSVAMNETDMSRNGFLDIMIVSLAVGITVFVMALSKGLGKFQREEMKITIIEMGTIGGALMLVFIVMALV